MPVRIVRRKGSAELGGSDSMESGGMADPLNTGAGGNQQDCGSADMESGGMADPLLAKQHEPDQQQKPDHPKNDGHQTEHGSPTVAMLQSKAGEIISALHQAKLELASELEANLKQLKSVLQETQRIAKEMEAVLREAKAEPDPKQMAQGGHRDDRGDGRKARQDATGKGDEGATDWEPPYMKKNGSQNSDEAWEPPKEAVEVYKN